MLNTCKICGDVILGLMNNVLDVAKINAEKLELSIQPVSFYILIEKVWSVSAIKMREKGLKGHLNLSGNLPQYLEVDSHRLNQILLNVIGNATKFTNNGFVKVIISWHNGVDLEELGEPNYEFLSYSRIQREKSSPLKIVEESSEGLLDGLRDCTSNYLRPPRETRARSFRNEMDRDLAKRTFVAKTLSDVNDSANQIILSENEKHIEARSHNHFKSGGESPRKQPGILKIEVIDTGCGISPSALERIFQPFTQADSSITRRFGGTGLGLYISKQLVNKMGGKMYAYSEEHCGTNFCILIPTQSATAQDIDDDKEGAVNIVASTTKETTPTIKKRTENHITRALVVEDISLNQTLMTEYLKKMNIEADVANNGEEAVKKFREKGFGYYSCIFMDIQMPVMDGMTASKKIRRYEMRKNVAAEDRIPIIMVTGNCTEMEKNYCLDPEGDIKASYFFRKPFVFEECRSCVKNLLFSQEFKP